jgi:hypothetical protein
MAAHELNLTLLMGETAAQISLAQVSAAEAEFL